MLGASDVETPRSGIVMGTNNLADDESEPLGNARIWSDFLFPAVRGASGDDCDNGQSPGNTKNTDHDDVNGGSYYSDCFEEADDGGEEEANDGEGGHCGGGGEHFSVSTLPSNVSFKSLPSYMKAKSGVEMDPDRFRRRKQMILNLPEAQSARKQLQAIATNWDPMKNGQLLGFDAVSLDPTQFKEIFRRNFGVLLGARELGILVSLYDKRGEERADSLEFLKDFWQMGRDGRVSLARRRAEKVRQVRARQNKEIQERADRMSRLKEVAMGEHTEQDVRSALANVTEVAARYDTARDNSFHQLEQGGAMGLTTFREQLRTIFGIRLTRAEVDGLVSDFDLMRDGKVDGKEFAYRFHCLGRESRAAVLAEGAAKDERARRRKREQEEALAAKMRVQSKCKVKWDYSEEEFKRGRAIIAKAACFYDRERLGTDVDRIAQMKMDPTAFRAQMLQNFRVHLGPGELGAVFDDFDTDKSGLVDGAELMKTFFRKGREERAKRLAQAERQRRRIDAEKSRFRRCMEDRFIEQTTAKVIWPSLAHDPFNDEFGLDEHDGSITSRGTSAQGSTRAHISLGSVGGGQGYGREMGGSSSGGRSREGDRGGESSWRSARTVVVRSTISASTAEFLGKIDKEELTIRAMTTHTRPRRRRDGIDDKNSLGISRSPSAHYAGGRPPPISSSAYRDNARQKRHNDSAKSSGVGGPSRRTCTRRRRRRRSSRSTPRAISSENANVDERWGDNNNVLAPTSQGPVGCDSGEGTRNGSTDDTAQTGSRRLEQTTPSSMTPRSRGTHSAEAIAVPATAMSPWGGGSRRGTSTASASGRALESRAGGRRRSDVSCREGPPSTGSRSTTSRGLTTRGSTAINSNRDSSHGGRAINLVREGSPPERTRTTSNNSEAVRDSGVTVARDGQENRLGEGTWWA